MPPSCCVYQELWSLMTGGVSKNDHSPTGVFIKMMFEMGIFFQFLSITRNMIFLLETENKKLKYVSLSNVLYLNKPQNGELTHDQNLIKCYCLVTEWCLTLWDPTDGSTPHFAVLHISQRFLKLMSLSRWCQPTILSPLAPLSSYLRWFSASGSFLMSWLFPSSGQSTGVSASASVHPMNIKFDIL